MATQHSWAYKANNFTTGYLTLAIKLTVVKVTSLPPVFTAKQTSRTAHVFKAVCEPAPLFYLQVSTHRLAQSIKAACCYLISAVASRQTFHTRALRLRLDGSDRTVRTLIMSVGF